MSLENLNCPQFVDFTSGDIIDINDGADLIFGSLESKRNLLIN